MYQMRKNQRNKYPFRNHINLVTDFEKLLDKHLSDMGVCRKNPQDPAMDYFRLQQRLIENKPRNIKKANGFSYPVEYKKALDLIEITILNGGNIHPFMTRNLLKLKREDLMLSDWGIYHLHLSTEHDMVKKDGFMKRSNELLMVKIDETTVYFITVVPHKKRNVWTLNKYIEIIYDNWPEMIEKFKLKDIRLSEHITEEQRTQFRKAHGFVFTELEDGTCCTSMGGGYASDGTSMNALLAHDDLYRILESAEQVLSENIENYIKSPELVDIFRGNVSVDIRLMACNNSELLLIEENTKILIQMQMDKDEWKIMIASAEQMMLAIIDDTKGELLRKCRKITIL